HAVDDPVDSANGVAVCAIEALDVATLRQVARNRSVSEGTGLRGDAAHGASKRDDGPGEDVALRARLDRDIEIAGRNLDRCVRNLLLGCGHATERFGQSADVALR